jgi:hypothetical protein
MKKLILLLVVSLTLLITGIALAVEETQYEMALEHYNNGNFEKAIDILEEYVSQKPKPEAYFIIAYSLYKLGRHEEANEYFNDLFLIDPEYSPTPALMEAGKWPPKEIAKEAVKPEMPAVAPLPVEPVVEEPEKAVLKMPVTAPVEKAAPAPATVPEVPVEKAAPKPPVAAPVEKAAPAPAPAPEVPVEKVAPKPPAPAAVPIPKLPIPKLPIPKLPIPPMAISPVILIAVSIALYMLFCLPIFLIARKLNVPAAWTAWIPIIQVWAILKSADKSLWWVLLMLVPLINLIVFIYIWMCITQNLGKNKWLGLLMLVPVISIVYPFYLALSKTGAAPEGFAPEEFDLDKEPTLDIEDTSFLEEEPEQPQEEPASAGEEPSFFEEEPEQPQEEPASAGEGPSFFEEEPEQPQEESASAGEEPAGWSEPGEEQTEDESLAWGESGEEQSEDEPLAWGESDEESDSQQDKAE